MIGISNHFVTKRPAEIEGPVDRQEPGHKGVLAVRLRKLAIDAAETLQGVAEPAYQKSFRCGASAFEHRLDRTARTWLSFIGAPE